MDDLAAFGAGVLLCNSLPHIMAGLLGRPFPTPFARPSGVGDSTPLVNFLWGSANLFVGLFLLQRNFASATAMPGIAALAAGFVLMGLYASHHFGKVVQGAYRRPPVS